MESKPLRLKYLTNAACLLLLLALAGPAGARLLPVWVTKIVDGDTFQGLLDGKKITVRIKAIDTPETRRGKKRPEQPGAHEAKAFLKKWIYDQYVMIEYDGATFSRVVASTFNYKGRDVGRELVRAGWAWVDPRYNKDPTLSELMDQARAAKRGLWADPEPVSPWIWRRVQRANRKKP